MMYVNTPVRSPRNRKPRSTSRQEKPATGARYRQSRTGVYSPARGRVQSTYAKEPAKKRKASEFPKIRPWKVMLGSVLFGIAGLLYLNHVFYTQKLLNDVNHLQQKYDQAERIYNDRKFTYDRMIGPTTIYREARKLGMITGGPPDHILIVNH